MSKLLFIICATLALAGCDRGGTGDQYNTGTGGGGSMSNQPAPAVPAQGGANAPGGGSGSDMSRPTNSNVMP